MKKGCSVKKKKKNILGFRIVAYMLFTIMDSGLEFPFFIRQRLNLKEGLWFQQSMYVCIWVGPTVAFKLFIQFWWISCQSIQYYDPGNISYILTDFNNAGSRFYLVNHDFNRFYSFFSSIIRLPLGKNIWCLVFIWFICFEVLWVQKRVFWKLVCAYVCMWL